MKNYVLTESELLECNNTFAQHLFLVDKRDKQRGHLIDQFIDCDYLRIEGYGPIEFIEHHGKTTRYIITRSDLDPSESRVIVDFFDTHKAADDPFKQLESSWDNFHKTYTGIAYRGGKGYTYGIYEYIPHSKPLIVCQ